MLAAHWLPFLAVAALLTITPGPDMAIVTRSALDQGWRAAVRTTLGINLGVLVWAVAASVGLAALLAASALAFTVLKIAGAVYLIYLGITALRARPPEAPRTGGTRAFRRGLVANLLNPKIGVFYTTLLPQFVDRHHSVVAQSVSLALAHDLMGLIWLPFYAWLVVRTGALLRRPGIRKGLDRLTGTVLIGLGIRLALERR
jgi:threonine/homoserine/homoserine lactone efflux protein